jgi:hypothetical protein
MQAVLLGSPSLLPKMVQLLKVIAYFPAVDQWYAADNLDAVAQLMLHGQTARQLSNDWSHIDTLLSTAAAGSSATAAGSAAARTAAAAGALRSLPRATGGVLRGAVASAVAGAAAHLGAAATATAGDGTRATAAAAGAVMGAVTGGFIGEVARWLFDRQPNAFAATPPAAPTAATAAAAAQPAEDTSAADTTAGTDAAAAAAAALNTDSTDNAPIEVPGDAPAPRNDVGPQIRVQLVVEPVAADATAAGTGGTAQQQQLPQGAAIDVPEIALADLMRLLQSATAAAEAQLGPVGAGTAAAAGAAAGTADAAVVAPQLLPPPLLGPGGNTAAAAAAAGGGTAATGTARRGRRGTGASQARRTPADAARSELEYSALMLGPHQVEVLFVLSTLLGGRRKMVRIANRSPFCCIAHAQTACEEFYASEFAVGLISHAALHAVLLRRTSKR